LSQVIVFRRFTVLPTPVSFEAIAREFPMRVGLENYSLWVIEDRVILWSFLPACDRRTDGQTNRRRRIGERDKKSYTCIITLYYYTMLCYFHLHWLDI